MAELGVLLGATACLAILTIICFVFAVSDDAGRRY